MISVMQSRVPRTARVEVVSEFFMLEKGTMRNLKQSRVPRLEALRVALFAGEGFSNEYD